jgi:hypothetical protein
MSRTALADMMAFDREAFFALFAAYNDAIWPLQLVAYGLGLVVLAATLWRLPQRGRLVALVLAAMWAWNGAVYHWQYFATINFVAPVFAGFFVAQALLLAGAAVRGSLRLPARPGLAGWIGIALMLFAMAGYPLWGYLNDDIWPAVPAFGVAPCPTTIFTFGALLAARAPWWLFVIPVLWAAVGGSAAWLLAVQQDLSLPAAAVIAVMAALFRRR